MAINKPTEADLSDEHAFASYVNSQTTSSSGPLRTTASLNREPQYATTSYSISDLLQGSLSVNDPSDSTLIANQFLTKRLDDIYTSNPQKQYALLSGSYQDTSLEAANNSIYARAGFNEDDTINTQWVSELPISTVHSNSLQGPTDSATAGGSSSTSPLGKQIILWAKSGLASEVMHLPVAESINDDIKKHIQSPNLDQSRKHPYFMDRDAQDTRSTSAPFSGQDGYVYNWDSGENIITTSNQKTFGGEDPNKPGRKSAFGLLDPASEQWYVSMPWPCQLNAGEWTDIGLSAIDDFIKQENLTLSNYYGSKILVYHPKSRKAVICTPGDMGPRPSKLKYSPVAPNDCHLIGLSPDICSYFSLTSMADTVMVGFVDSDWPVGPYEKGAISPENLVPVTNPAGPTSPGSSPADPTPVVSPGDWSPPVPIVNPRDWSIGTSSKVLVDSIEEISYAMSLIRDHPNMWATKVDVSGTRNNYGTPKAVKSFYSQFTHGFPNASAKTFIKIPGSSRGWIFPSLINFLWITMESGWIWDGCAGAVGTQTKPEDPMVTTHELGSAIDFMNLGHVDYGGAYSWEMSWSTMPTRGPKGGPSSYKEENFRGPPTNNPKKMHYYTRYSELINLLAQFISSLPKDKRPTGLGAPFAVANSVIHQDWKPNHMHLDFVDGSRGKASLTNRIGKLLPQLKR